ncbi:MAG: hypothetical protein DLM70_00680, partial [Chloroflexi bacterium]
MLCRSPTRTGTTGTRRLLIEHTKVKPAVLVLGAAALLAGRLAGRNYRRLPLASSEPRAGNHSVSVIIPARDEAKTLPLLLESLARLSPCPAEIIVVDDGSSDGTGEVARGFGALVVRIETIP